MIIYKGTNTVNGKEYIGQTTRSLKDRIAGHRHNSNPVGDLAIDIEKYGWDAFEWSIIDTANSYEELYEKEQYWINELDTLNGGYNNTTGGKRNCVMTDRAKEKQSEGKRRAWELVTDEERKVFCEIQSKDKTAYYKDPDNRKKTSTAMKDWWASLSDEERTIRSKRRSEQAKKQHASNNFGNIPKE